MERRKIDSKARITLPVTLCAALGVAQGDYVEIIQNGNGEWVIVKARQG